MKPIGAFSTNIKFFAASPAFISIELSGFHTYVQLARDAMPVCLYIYMLLHAETFGDVMGAGRWRWRMRVHFSRLPSIIQAGQKEDETIGKRTDGR